MTNSSPSLEQVAQTCADALQAKNRKVVFAESCTAGLVAATLATVPGVSQWLCGSAVTYRESVKRDWLGVSAEDLLRETAVSGVVTGQMAAGVLARTEEAQLAVAVTGHLGPNAPTEQDGVVYIAIAFRDGERGGVLPSQRFQLAGSRTERQHEATRLVLLQAIQWLRENA